MSLAKLKVGPFRRGRGGNLDEVNRKEQESVERDEVLRAAVVELCASVETLEGSSGSPSSSTVHREAFGYANATTAANFVPFASHPAEATSAELRNVWRAPFAGSITRVSIITSANAGSTEAQWFDPSGAPAIGSAVTETPSAFPVQTGSGYLAVFDFDDVTVTSGGLYALRIDPTSTIGNVTGWLELTAS